MHLHSSVTVGEQNLTKYSNLSVYACTVRFPYWNVRNSASLSCLALSGKYFSRNLVLKEVQVTTSSRVCINCCIPTHQYFASATSRNVTNVSLYAVDHSTDLLTLSEPSVCLIRSGFARELRGHVSHEILHNHRASGCDHSSRMRYNGLHRVHHLMDHMCYLISPIIPSSLVSHSLSTRHIPTIIITQLSYNRKITLRNKNSRNLSRTRKTISSLPKYPNNHFENHCSDTKCNIPVGYYEFLIK